MCLITRCMSQQRPFLLLMLQNALPSPSKNPLYLTVEVAAVHWPAVEAIARLDHCLGISQNSWS